jgi:hypothetical protein
MPAQTGPLAKLNKKELAQFETIATGLKNDGYTGAVVCRKMISQYEMSEEAATELVSQLFGKSVDPRRGDTTFAIVGGLVVAAITGSIGGAIFWFIGFNKLSLLIGGPLITVAVGALARAFIASMNADVKEDLRDPPGGS